MRVLHFAHYFSPLPETYIYDYITGLAQQGVENHVVTFERKNKEKRPFPNVHTVNHPNRWHPRRIWNRMLAALGTGERRTAGWPVVRKQLKATVRRTKPDIIHAHFGPPGVLIAPVAASTQTPLAITFYGNDVSGLAKKTFWKKKYLDTFRLANLLVGISNHVCSRLSSLGAPRKKVRCWHLGVDISRFDYTRADKSFDGKQVHCVHIGRLVEKKSPIDLVESFNNALEKLPHNVELSLTIAGDGPLRNKVERSIQFLGIEDRVSILGAIPHSKVSELLREANLYTQHCKTAPDGDQEGLGVSFIEASATGLPIVSTRHNGLPDVILDGQTGILVEEGDVEAMGDAIAFLAERPSEWVKMGEAGRRHVEETFDLHTQVTTMKNWLFELTESGKR